jgi:modulator of FtsH protease
MTALGGTGVIFIGLSAYALTTRKDFSFLGGFLMVGILVAFLAWVVSPVFTINVSMNISNALAVLC